ncbi:MAG TPA: L,D-transpeptidase family protein [Pyrinomonadaceae bacterium]|nr:L,D-transpeptidase family protein [Pyrinomonadaceae bacterium]
MHSSRQQLGLLIALVAVAVLITSVRMQTMEKHSTPNQIDERRLVIRKGKRTLDVYDGTKLVKTYTVVLGFAPDGDKEKEGDGKTPEGEFYVFTKNAKSRFHLSLGISYPAKDDASRGLRAGMITRTQHDEILNAIDSREMPPQKTALGGEIYIHGGGTDRDWTWGCVAMSNGEIEELFATIPVGTPVTILP